MLKGIIKEICIRDVAGEPMRSLSRVLAIPEKGLEGDAYAIGKGSFNTKKRHGENKDKWHGQVTLMNAKHVTGSGFEFIETRRNLLVDGVELMRCINKEFYIGEGENRVTLFGYKYCEPCKRPSDLIGHHLNFQEVFHDTGGLIAEVRVGGIIKVGDIFIPPPKSY